MNLDKLKEAEARFLDCYPGGFHNPEIAALRVKRHNVDKMIAFAQESFARPNFKHPELIVQNLVRLISRSSIISMYEKPKCREFIHALSAAEQQSLTKGLKEYLHGDEKAGFDIVLEMLKREKLAKWSLMTAGPGYFHPQRDILVKPTTVKAIIVYFELDHLVYKPAPTWAFYQSYRTTLHEMKSQVDFSLSPSNIAFSWFLLLSFRRDLF